MRTVFALYCAVLIAVVALVLTVFQKTRIVTHTAQGRTVTVFIRNLDPVDFTDAQIRHDIPAWEQAINVDFARYWGTPQYRLVFIGRRQAPFGARTATFVKKGPVKGALAYHTVENGAPAIIVYSGTGRYYGYDDSVSFTHELEEEAADEDVSTVKQGWPYDYVWLEHKNGSVQASYQIGVLGWFGEVSDPVEADSYRIDGVKISDFVTRAWFNVGSGSRYDFMGVCQQPFWIRPGGYAQFETAQGWNLIMNFRGAGRDAAGFLRGEGLER